MEGMFRPKFVDGRYKHDVFAQREIWHHFFKYDVAIGSRWRSMREKRYTLVQKGARKVLDNYKICKFSIFVQASAVAYQPFHKILSAFVAKVLGTLRQTSLSQQEGQEI